MSQQYGACLRAKANFPSIGPDWSRDPSKLGEPVNFGSQVDRHKQRGPPVVPGSVQKVHEDFETILYTVTILRSQYEVCYCHMSFDEG